MSPLKKLLGFGLSILLDFGSGVIIMYLIWVHIFGFDIVWYYYFLGIYFAKNPDIDEVIPNIIELVGGPENDSSHKALATHEPFTMIAPTLLTLITWSKIVAIISLLCLILYYVCIAEKERIFGLLHSKQSGWDKFILIIILLANLIAILAPVIVTMATWNKAIAWIAIACQFFHFFYDSWQCQQDGPGVRWFAPFGNKYYQVFSRNAKGEPMRLFLVVTPERLEWCFTITNEYWFNTKFFRFTWENAIGIMVFDIAILILLITLL
jgi:hypothetical protein